MGCNIIRRDTPAAGGIICRYARQQLRPGLQIPKRLPRSAGQPALPTARFFIIYVLTRQLSGQWQTCTSTRPSRQHYYYYYCYCYYYTTTTTAATTTTTTLLLLLLYYYHNYDYWYYYTTTTTTTIIITITILLLLLLLYYTTTTTTTTTPPPDTSTRKNALLESNHPTDKHCRAKPQLVTSPESKSSIHPSTHLRSALASTPTPTSTMWSLPFRFSN